ncbi:isochorismatase family protein [Streptomyces caniscabiei]|uniref:Isochorismatase family protein n=1 Tax=Streptomyces caniscabiei TaxID=2746961 RepID=A0A927KX26_9ACTN|nr:isochorismatase family protein [Streptomyces caniscabiei]MBD9721705.1 isochorismatase family protein [Streptomyces caniscabiei]MDX3508897.1 isochorismatase family protein [Streptomyces caniscabiei]MDX3717350.1 isochorismatase family protein [Streptomyces caniscabiei]MDX3728039.1 isochorismatase family protein [Streptomyces caniscabiei]WEO23201.1 isochorismatase family protein [Streptomyces caniscabiei]
MSGIPPVHSYPLPTASDLPGNTAPWVPDAGRAVLLVHDMQRYFLKPLPADGTLRDELVGHAVRLRERCAAAGVPVAYTAQPGGMDERERGLLKDFWGPGMRTAPEDRQIVDELAPAETDRMFTKWRYSAFFRSGLLDWMRESGRDQLILCGVYAHVGVLVTAVDAFSHDIETFLVADAVADFSERHHRIALEYAAERCAVVLTTEALVTSLDAVVTAQ